MAKNSLGVESPLQSSQDIRNSFLEFFGKKAHTFVRSSPTFPKDDPTILFTNAGMNQFKPIILGDNKDGLKRAVNSQKCLRVSGKHNDLDEVGRDNYHHTFFEMLGNWSFGDYYKVEAISWAWELLTEIWKVPKNRLFATIYKDDDEAEAIWRKHTDIDPKRILRFDGPNFWEMGDVGPCGPCSEIHFDLGSESDRDHTFSHPVLGVNGKNHRYIELWNLVFMQYERKGDGSLVPLKEKHVDTGMGFERMLSVIQGTGSNYATDVFLPIIDQIAHLSGVPFNPGELGTPHRVIADHLRALAFAIADGATPGNEGRGYVLRRILRRASKFAGELGQRSPFIYKLVPTLAKIMGDAFPEVRSRADYVGQVIQAEEVRFLRTLEQGIARFAKMSAQIPKGGVLSGKDAFALFDTFGFPLDLTQLLAVEKGLTVDTAEYDIQMNEQRERARSSQKIDPGLSSDELWTILDPSISTEFTGYSTLKEDRCQTLRYREIGDEILVVLKTSPFYAESGGQVGDQGQLTGEGVCLGVIDTIKVLDLTIHRCTLKEGLITPDTMKILRAEVDPLARQATMANHSATHLLQAVLIEVLGTHVHQQGSKVDAHGLRFDFTHNGPINDATLDAIEYKVNEAIRKNVGVETHVTSLENAKKSGAIALFGEKYSDSVRVVTMGSDSKELCGGTHVAATGNIGYFRITSESSIAAGVRRIEAQTGHKAISSAQADRKILGSLAKDLRCLPSLVAEKFTEISEKTRLLERDNQSLRAQQVSRLIKTVLANDNTNGIVAEPIPTSEGFTRDHLQLILDTAADMVPSRHVIVLTFADKEQLDILVAVPKDLQSIIKAGDLAKQLAEFVGGKGGGRPDRARAGAKTPSREQDVLKQAKAILAQKALNF